MNGISLSLWLCVRVCVHACMRVSVNDDDWHEIEHCIHLFTFNWTTAMIKSIHLVVIHLKTFYRAHTLYGHQCDVGTLPFDICYLWLWVPGSDLFSHLPTHLGQCRWINVRMHLKRNRTPTPNMHTTRVHAIGPGPAYETPISTLMKYIHLDGSVGALCISFGMR